MYTLQSIRPLEVREREMAENDLKLINSIPYIKTLGNPIEIEIFIKNLLGNGNISGNAALIAFNEIIGENLFRMEEYGNTIELLWSKIGKGKVLLQRTAFGIMANRIIKSKYQHFTDLGGPITMKEPLERSGFGSFYNRLI